MAELRLLVPRQRIDRAVCRLAARIQRDYQGRSPLLVGVLKGTFIFLADLVRQLDLPLEVEFIQLSSYSGTQTVGRVRVTRPLRTIIKGRDVLVIEDIVDTGLTTAFLMKYLKRRSPASLKLCTLFDKPSRRQVKVRINYRGLVLPDKFVAGYGLDWNQQYRHLPDLWSVEGVE